MDRIDVVSSNLASIGYEAENETLEIEFHNGGIYQYYAVPPQTYADLMDANSKGRYFDQFIKKGGFRYERVN